jgi:hypothetical protein
MQTETEAPNELAKAPTIPEDGEICADFSDADTKTPSELGRSLHIASPKSGKLWYHPDGRPVTIKFVGPDSDTVKIIHRRLQDDANEKAAGAQNSKGPDARDVQEQRNADDLAACCRGWDLPPIDGETLTFSLVNAKKFFRDPRFKRVAIQCTEFVYLPRVFFGERSLS